MRPPDTRISLIVRLRDTSDADAWREFEEVYRPIILRIALAKGLQRADAEDLAQTVLLSVSRAIERFDPNGKAKFRTWLKRIADNAVLNAITRAKPDRGGANAAMVEFLDQEPARSGPDSDLLKIEYRREILHWAARRIRNEFTETTWQAFWLTAVEAKSPEQVGALLGRTRGSIYAARSRVMRRLVQEVNQFDEGEYPQ